jgi:hypothetical protein
MMIRPLLRADAALFHAHRLAALQESPEAFGSTFEEDRLLSPDSVAERIEETFVAPRRVVLGAFADDMLQGFVGCMQEHKAKSRHKANDVKRLVLGGQKPWDRVPRKEPAR